MKTTHSGSSKRGSAKVQDTTFESLQERRHSSSSSDSASQGLGSGMLDQLMGNYESDFSHDTQKKDARHGNVLESKSSVFRYSEHRENVTTRQEIQQLTEEIRREINTIKSKEASLMTQVKDMEKLTLDSLSETPGIYHIRFLELVLSMLRALRASIGESQTWLAAFTNKRAKRGSAFAVKSKKMGTEYSLGNEVSTARAVQ